MYDSFARGINHRHSRMIFARPLFSQRLGTCPLMRGPTKRCCGRSLKRRVSPAHKQQGRCDLCNLMNGKSGRDPRPTSAHRCGVKLCLGMCHALCVCAATQKLERREQEAKVRKAKYADVGMTNIAAAMMQRDDKK